MRRWKYNMSHTVIQPIAMGYLQSFGRWNVLPGDTWHGTCGIFARLSPMVRAVLSDFRWDVYLFYVPHRYCYRNDWRNYIKEGPIDETPTSLPTYGANHSISSWCHNKHKTSTILKHIPISYWQIYNNYFKDPQDSDVPTNTIPTDDGTLDHYGKLVCRLKTLASTIRKDSFDTDGGDITIGSDGKFNVLELREAKDDLRVERLLKVFNQRDYYSKAMKIIFDTNVFEPQDEIPELVAHTSGTTNISDVVAKGDERLGQMVGHGEAGLRLEVKPKHFSEHGTLWGLIVCRNENFMTQYTPWTDEDRGYKQMVGDPRYADLPPVEVKYRDIGASGSTSVVGHQPYYQWFRGMESYVNEIFWHGTEGWSVDQGTPSTWENLVKYPGKATSDAYFTTSEFGHAQMVSKNRLNVIRAIPPVTRSII